MASFYEPTPNTTDAYYTDGTNKFFGRAPKGSGINDSRWQIFKMEYTGDNWIIKFPKDPVTSLGTDAPKFVWSSVSSYTFNVLGT